MAATLQQFWAWLLFISCLSVLYHSYGCYCFPRGGLQTIDGQPFCVKYTTRLYGVDTRDSEVAFIESIVNNTYDKLTVHPLARAWFNGTNNDGSDFIGDLVIQKKFLEHLYGFFGLSLGCTFYSQFPAEYRNFDPDMTKMHGVGADKNNFHKPISKESFEIHNQVVCDFLYARGVDPGDIILVAKALDSFRTGFGNSTNFICQDQACTQSPYKVYVRDNYFLPPYLSVPPGNTVSFIPTSTHEHTITSSDGVASCDASPAYNYDMPGFGASPVNIQYDTLGTHPYKCSYHCSAGMYGVIEVSDLAKNPSSPASSSSSSSSASSLSRSPLKGILF